MSIGALATHAKSSPAKATLKISGIPLQCDSDRLKRALHDQPGFTDAIDVAFDATRHPESRVKAMLEGLSPTMTAWAAETIRTALKSAGVPRYELCALLFRQ